MPHPFHPVCAPSSFLYHHAPSAYHSLSTIFSTFMGELQLPLSHCHLHDSDDCCHLLSEPFLLRPSSSHLSRFPLTNTNTVHTTTVTDNNVRASLSLSRLLNAHSLMTILWVVQAPISHTLQRATTVEHVCTYVLEVSSAHYLSMSLSINHLPSLSSFLASETCTTTHSHDVHSSLSVFLATSLVLAPHLFSFSSTTTGFRDIRSSIFIIPSSRDIYNYRLTDINCRCRPPSIHLPSYLVYLLSFFSHPLSLTFEVMNQHSHFLLFVSTSQYFILFFCHSSPPLFGPNRTVVLSITSSSDCEVQQFRISMHANYTSAFSFD